MCIVFSLVNHFITTVCSMWNKHIYYNYSPVASDILVQDSDGNTEESEFYTQEEYVN